MIFRHLALVKPFPYRLKLSEKLDHISRGRLVICGLLKFIKLLLVFGSFWNDSLKKLAKPFHFGLIRFIEII